MLSQTPVSSLKSSSLEVSSPKASSPKVSSLDNLDLDQLVDRILRSRTITRQQQQELTALIMADGQISPEEQRLIDKVWKGLQDGRLQVLG